MHQVILERTYILDTSSSSCIDLIFTSKPNLTGVHSSLHSNCHHQIIFAKFNLEIVYPPPYVREVWHYKNADTVLIRRAIKEFSWQRAFFNTNVKGGTKLYLTHYSCVVLILFNTGLCWSAFSRISFRKLVFRFSVFSVFFVLSQDIKICVIII